ncbi:MAG: prepilin-type N-terminal cleavage/methylation domain-containing protein [Thauera sp.]|jgi:type IV pilus assembly protein PilW|nr:prepilin-type N-terminal cleavage/methylation domain-containing protein [Thauera sp.]
MKAHISSRHQQGLSLIELMIGLMIGLMVVAVAMSALMAARGVSGTVSDASAIQQQAAYAMRVIGQQLRQTGSLHLNLNPNNITGDTDILTLAAVGLEISGSTEEVLSGTDNSLDIYYTRYTEPTFTGAAEISHSRNCLGLPAEGSTDERFESLFSFSANQLRCAGNGVTDGRSIIGNVADFQLRYLLQDKGESGNPKLIYAASGDVGDWDQVQGIEVCLVLFGDERIDIPAGSTYTGCSGTAQAYADNRMHLLFRNVFQLRSQGLLKNS